MAMAEDGGLQVQPLVTATTPPGRPSFDVPSRSNAPRKN
jgi:hypothetical protein